MEETQINKNQMKIQIQMIHRTVRKNLQNPPLIYLITKNKVVPEIIMDEEKVEIEIGGLYLLGVEDACMWKEISYMPPTQIQLLKEYLAKEKYQKKFEV